MIEFGEKTFTIFRSLNAVTLENYSKPLARKRLLSVHKRSLLCLPFTLRVPCVT